MNSQVSSSGKFARRILVLAVILGCGFGAYWFFVLRNPDPTRQAPKVTEPELIKMPVVERQLMGTLAKIAVYAPSEEIASNAIAAAFQRGEEIAAICTDYEEDSELSLLSKAPLDKPVDVSPTLAAALAHAHATADVTDGVFDPTLGPLTRLWRESRRKKELPAPEVLAKAKAASGWKNFEVEPASGFVVLKEKGMRFDLGGIGKGFAADEMMKALNLKGIRVAFIAIGGDVRLGDPPPGREAWRVGIRTLGPNVNEFLQLSNCAVSTSGDLHQYVEIEGVRYSHIIDPATGLGLTERIAATVVAPTATQSDPFATFCCIKPEDALRAFNAGDIACRIVTMKSGFPEERLSGNFPPVDSL